MKNRIVFILAVVGILASLCFFACCGLAVISYLVTTPTPPVPVRLETESPIISTEIPTFTPLLTATPLSPGAKQKAPAGMAGASYLDRDIMPGSTPGHNLSSAQNGW